MHTIELCNYVSELLSVSESADYSDNGLQVHASDKITKIAFCVDASLSSFERAASLKADLLIVHHGLFWGRSAMMSGYMGERVRFLFENNLSLYAVHLPLDAHPTMGNSFSIVDFCGAEICGWFAKEKGLQLGCLGRLIKPMMYSELKSKLNTALNGEPLGVVAEPEPQTLITTVGSVTGGGMRFALEAHAAGADLYISGEPSHAWYHPILETGVPCMLYGHYATETQGLKHLKNHLEEQFSITTVFIDDPTGM